MKNSEAGGSAPKKKRTHKRKKTKTAEEWGNAFKKKYPIYSEFTEKLRDLFVRICQQNNIEVAQIESRCKSIESFIEKVKRSGCADPFEDITDLSGIRIITYYKENVDKIGSIIEKEFEVDIEKSADKSDILDPDRFGYLSVHYVVSLSSPRKYLTEWKSFKDLKAEVQVRTVLQHAWAAIDHKLRYKTAKEVPRDLRRQLFRLSALLELADDEFSDLRGRTVEIEEHYESAVRKGKLDIEMDLSSLKVYIETTEKLKKWNERAKRIGFRNWTEFEDRSKKYWDDQLASIMRCLHRVGVRTIGELDDILENVEWGVKALKEFYQMSTAEGWKPYAVSHDVIVFLVYMAKRESLTEEIIEATDYNTKIKRAFHKMMTEHSKADRRKGKKQ